MFVLIGKRTSEDGGSRSSNAGGRSRAADSRAPIPRTPAKADLELLRSVAAPEEAG
jgi:hypothetical protein